MKTLTSILSILILFTQNSFAVVYTTISNGLMEDPSIWIPSLPPSSLPVGDSIIIEHQIDLSVNFTVEGTLIINSGRSLSNTNKTLNINYTGKVIVNGLLVVKNINNDGLLTNNSRVEIYGNLINNGVGSSINGTNGVFRLQNRAINNASGNISGTVDFCRFDEISDPMLSNSGTVDWSTVTVCHGAFLPVTLVSFSAKSDGEKITLEWTSSEEKNSSHFEVEKSLDGTGFVTISIVGAIENNNGKNNYKAYDNNTDFYTAYYRLKQVDKNGEYEYSKTVSVTSGISGDLFTIFPNPAECNVQINGHVIGGIGSEMIITIFDQWGQKISSQVVEVNKEKNFALEEDTLFKPGVYVVFASLEDKSYAKKLVIK